MVCFVNEKILEMIVCEVIIVVNVVSKIKGYN